MVHHLILDLLLVGVELFVHVLPFLSVSERHHAVQVVVGLLCRFEIGSFDEVVEGNERLEESWVVATLCENRSTRW